tara:strand:+ start:96 stop:575 length:480 start_codon:yes stop_codon:yes gene_type:complete
MDIIELFFNKFYKDFQEYTYKNKVLVAASGFAIGMATTNLLKNIVDDILTPAIIELFKYLLSLSPLYTKHPILYYFVTKISNFIWLFIVWLLTIFVSFFVIEYLLNRKIIGLSSSVKDNEKKEFIKEKILSKETNNILPTEKDKIQMENEKELVENNMI